MLAVADGASAQSQYSWDGVYAGANLGTASNNTCNSWSLTGAPIDPTIAAAFSNRTCPNNSAFVGGVRIGDNFQYKRLVWGLGAEVDDWNAKNHNLTFKYMGSASPAGTYALTGKLNPSGFAILGPRIGYAGDHWLPYLRAGTIITGGSNDSTLSYTPVGATKPTASFSGGKNFASTGWVAGGGVELVLSGPWSISAEYLHANLGKGSNSTSTCTGAAAACAAFSGVSLDSVHNSLTANMFRIGFNYWFWY
ncbi:MAG TPA: outer membrane beta-barrel protein [Steroidobacteraceae bacterium]|nr:outer membrane beta-barrel protein [Steroidobacteraceae bacterium]